MHVSEMSWTKKNAHPSKLVSTSEEVEVMVLDVDKDKRRISLGMKQCMDNPWTDLDKKFKIGDEIEGEINNVTEFGLFVGLTDNVDGMVHLSDVSWEDESEDALKAYKKGEMVKAKILDIDIEKERVALSIKQLTDDPFEGALDGLKKGQIVTCTVSKIMASAVEVVVQEGVIGVIKKSDLSRERSEQRPDRFAVDEKVDAKITNMDPKTRKLTLSIKAREIDEDKQAMKEFGSTESGASLGDILGAALQEKQGDTPKEEKPKAEKKAKAAPKKVTKKKTEEKTDSKAEAEEKTEKKPKAASKAKKKDEKPEAEKDA